MCVANCEAVGLYLDTINNMCVGCHPACETCFGPDYDDCFECSPGFVQVDKNKCDTACSPENSYIIDQVCFRNNIYYLKT